MLRNSILLVCASPFLPAGLPAGVSELSTDYTSARSLVTETTLTFTMETVENTFTRDGEPMEGRGRPGGSSELIQRVTVRDRVLAQEDNVPSSVRRSFEVAEGELTVAARDEDVEVPLESPLAGLVFEITDEDGELSYEIVEGSLSDEEHFEGQGLALTLDALLPSSGVEVGDTWEIESDALAHLLLLDVQPHLFPAPEREQDSGEGEGRRGRRGGPAQGGGNALGFLRGAEFETEAEFSGMEEGDDGAELARVVFTSEAEGTVERGEGGRGGDSGGGPGGGSGETTFTIELKGELLFSLATRRPVSLSVEGNVGRITDRSFDRGGSSMSTYREEAGVFGMTVEISEEADD